MSKEAHVVAGVDTDADTNYAAVVTVTGQHLAAAQFPATRVGYEALARFITCHGPLVRVGVEGTNSYGAALTRHLVAAGVCVVEVIRPKRQVRRMRGKSDEIDAYAAAHTALAGTDTVTPKASIGRVEALRVTAAARRLAVKARSEAIQQIKSLLVTAPEQIRADYRGLGTTRLVARLAGLRDRAGDDVVAAATRTALKQIATRYQQLDAEIESHNTDLVRLVNEVNPAILQVNGIGVVTAAQLLATAGDNPQRITGEAAFALICGAAPIPASSGKTTRYRLNRGGDRDANCALHHIAVVRLGKDPATRAYAARRTAEGKTKKEILRCLKRAIAREVFHLIVNPQPIEPTADLRPLRQRLGLTLTDVAIALGSGINTISALERGTVRNRDFLHRYRHWLTHQQSSKTAA